VRVNQLWGFIDQRGNFIIPPSFRSAHSFSDGLALVANEDQQGFIDKTGAFKILVTGLAEPFSEGLAVVPAANDRYISIDTRGKPAFPGNFMYATRFFHGLAHVKISEETYAYIDKTGKPVFTYRR
jgi:hypothetical protein